MNPIFKRRLLPLVVSAWALIASVTPAQTNTDSKADSPAPSMPLPLKAEGIENFFQLSGRIYSGASPEGDAAFATLQKLGIKTVITVDGSTPNLALAHKYGLRYVHLPHGYNGIDTITQGQLIKAAESLPTPIFIHCHHGKHRGPTAAAVVCMSTEGWNQAQAEAWLVTAGTSTNYLGLFKTVRQFHPPSANELKDIPSDFPESAKASALVDAMVAIDERWENLRAVRKADYEAPEHHRDLDPANEALILREHFREAQRLKDSISRGEAFVEKLKAAEINAHAAEVMLRQIKAVKSPDLRAQLDKALDVMGQSCAACHKSSRDKAVLR